MAQTLNPARSIAATLALSFCAANAFAAEVPDSSVDRFSDQEQTRQQTQPQTRQSAKTVDDVSLPSDEQKKPDAKKEAETEEYLLKHVDELEYYIVYGIKTMNADALRKLAPIYRKVPDSKRDDSAVMWSDAIIALSENRLTDAIKIYRELNSALPNNNTLRFQLAMSLYLDKQYEAAKDQFERLRASGVSDADKAVVDRYIHAIDHRNDWNFSASANYVHSDNVNASPKEGTKIQGPSGTASSDSKPESAHGISWSLGLDRKNPIDDKLYWTINLNNWGTVYKDYAKYNDLTFRLGLGLGYDDGRLNIDTELYGQKRLYGGGASGSRALRAYYSTTGARLWVAYWLSPKFRLDGSGELGYDKYDPVYDVNTGMFNSQSATAMLFRNQSQYFWLGLDRFRKHNKNKSGSFTRNGVRLGWFQEWPAGFSTRATVGYGYRYYDAPDFFNIKQKKDEYSASLALWNKKIHLWGVTPRLVYRYNKYDGNNPFYNYKENSVNVEFSKTF